MSVYIIDPVRDPRWTAFLGCHPDASVFHSTGWIDALQRTYGYRPLALTTSRASEPLTNGLPFCTVKGWRANRLVSLPFSDHCEPLIERLADRNEILAFLAGGIKTGQWKSFELRPRSSSLAESSHEMRPSREYQFHRCDLTLPLDAIFARFHRSCVRRPIRRAERESLEYRTGSSPSCIEAFYRLLRITRRRHGLVPQPIAWFRNLAATLGEDMRIHLASMAGRPIAGILTLGFKKSLVYKYGVSDARFHKFGGMPFLFWRAIQDARKDGFEELDLGRSDVGHEGLTTFKERLGAERLTLTYYRQPASMAQAGDDWKARAARWMFERLPDPALTLAGRVLYKHFA